MEVGVYISSRTLNRIEESMTDLILCELAGVEPHFAAAILRKFGVTDDLSVRSVCRSVHESSLGETDVEIVLSHGTSNVGLLIENKIRAIRMERQFERYRLRGHEGVAKGNWQHFKVILLAPQRYIDMVSQDEAQFLDGCLSYEWVVEWLSSEDPRRHAFKIHVFQEAIRDSRIGYQKKRDTHMTAFHQGVYAIANSEFPLLRMNWVDKAGNDDSIIHLPDALPVRGDKLLLKAKMGRAELRCDTKDPIATERALEQLIAPEWRTTRAKGYAGVEIPVEPIDPTLEFQENELKVRKFLSALYALRSFYHQPDVTSVIEANRGVR